MRGCEHITHDLQDKIYKCICTNVSFRLSSFQQIIARITPAQNSCHCLTDARLFPDSVFAQAPQARALFKRVGADDIHSPAFKAHIARVNGGLDMAISLLDNEPTLNAELAHLNGQHKERGIPSNYYDVSTLMHAASVLLTLDGCESEQFARTL